MQSPPVRKNEEVQTWFRSDRVFLHEAGNWYFRTREGIEIGPYDTRFEAEIEAGLLIELLQKAGDVEDRAAVVNEFILDGVAMGHDLKPMHNEELVAASS
ncbi:MAG: hypothetical protein GKR90_23310 [Pseudomonadales bacterium]|nr:hypothetical protein [Pseudomonadales bacterium]